MVFPALQAGALNVSQPPKACWLLIGDNALITSISVCTYFGSLLSLSE